MGWNVPGYRADNAEAADGDLESWHGTDEASGADVIMRRMRGRANDLDEANWRSAAILGIDHPGLAAPRQILCNGDDLVVVYDAAGPRAAVGDRSRAAAYVAALICAVADQLHALHLAGMTHGSVGATTVRRGDRDAVLIGAAESGLRDGSSDDTALDDVRSLAALGIRLLGPGKRSNSDGTRSLSAILAAAAAAAPAGGDPCEPSLSAELKRQCAPYVDDQPIETIPAPSPPGGPNGGEYVARHRRAPTRRRWIRVSRVRRRSRTRRRVVPTRAGIVSGPATGIAVVTVLVAIAAWMGTVWGGDAAPQGSAPMGAMQPRMLPTDSVAIDATSGTAAFDADSASAAQWAGYLGALYLDRASAITNRTAELLDRVYVPSSAQRDADLSVINTLTDSGARIAGFAPELVAVSGISRAEQIVIVNVVDRIPPYVLVDVAGVATTHAGRGEQAVTLTLKLVDDTWLIDTAIRVV